jgi:hypothetical protein
MNSLVSITITNERQACFLEKETEIINSVILLIMLKTQFEPRFLTLLSLCLFYVLPLSLHAHKGSTYVLWTLKWDGKYKINCHHLLPAI